MFDHQLIRQAIIEDKQREYIQNRKQDKKKSGNSFLQFLKVL
ncbi:hypothetical protein [Halalkalibacillus halophilus]|nr:hypothetical protein [Halalkalibacillus halophilus]